MSAHIVKIHGLEWSINTDDWSDSDAQEIAHREMVSSIEALGNDKAARVHAALLADPDFEREHPEISEIEKAAFCAAVKGWHSIPQSGHNCSIGAVAGGAE